MKNDNIENELTIKQERACQAFIENNGNRSKAYRTAFDAENMSDESVNVEACRLFKNPKITLRVVELQSEHRERHNVTIDKLTDELNQARNLAMDAKQTTAMISATMGKAKLHGFITNKKQISGRFDFKSMSNEELERVIHGEL